MINYSKKLVQLFAGMLLLTVLAACGSNSSSTPAPTTVPATATVLYSHNLVFRNSTTHSMGYNAFGQLGNGNLVNRIVPGHLKHYYPFAGFATGGDHSIAFFNNSTVRCWGFNASGQLGNNSTTYKRVPVPAFDVVDGVNANISGIKAVAAGAFHSLALKNDDTLWAWGGNGAGQLGIGDTTPQIDKSKVPLMVVGAAAGFVNISSIAANGRHSLALADGKVWAWGLNGSGQLGLSKDTRKLINPGVVPDLPTSGISAIAAGGAFSYAVDRGGFLWAWGNNLNGELGDGTTESRYTPEKVKKANRDYLSGVKQAAAGIQHGLALLSDGTVWAWGYNHFGQLGNNSTPDSPFAVRVHMPAGVTVTEIRAFGSSSMAKVGDSWYVWGDNTYGQLGVGTTVSVLFPRRMSGF